MTRRRGGIASSTSAPVESISRGSRCGNPGISAVREPAATIARSNPISVVPPGAATLRRWGDENVPAPSTTSTLRCLASPASPRVSRATTVSFQPASLAGSIEGGPNSTPCAAISAAPSMTAAAWSSAFEGMHPTLRQTPPRVG